jgi:hypothetical protein
LAGEELSAEKFAVLRDSEVFTGGGGPLRRSALILSLSFFSNVFLSIGEPSWGEVNWGEEEGCFFQKELNPLKVDFELCGTGAATLIF